MVLDLGLPDMTGFELIERIKQDAAHNELPIIVYTGKELTQDGGDRASPRRRGDHRQGRQVAGAAARRDRALPPPRRGATCRNPSGGCSSSCTSRTTAARGRKVLIVDDDVRNIFALTSVARALRHPVHVRRERQGRDRAAQDDGGHRCRSHGHHDAGDGRLRNHAGNPQARQVQVACRSSRSPPRP